MLRHLSQPSGPLEIPHDRGGLGGLRRRIFIALQPRKLASLLYWAAVSWAAALQRHEIGPRGLKTAPVDHRPPAGEARAGLPSRRGAAPSRAAPLRRPLGVRVAPRGRRRHPAARRFGRSRGEDGPLDQARGRDAPRRRRGRRGGRWRAGLGRAGGAGLRGRPQPLPVRGPVGEGPQARPRKGALDARRGRGRPPRGRSGGGRRPRRLLELGGGRGAAARAPHEAGPRAPAGVEINQRVGRTV